MKRRGMLGWLLKAPAVAAAAPAVLAKESVKEWPDDVHAWAKPWTHESVAMEEGRPVMPMSATAMPEPRMVSWGEREDLSDIIYSIDPREVPLRKYVKR